MPLAFPRAYDEHAEAKSQKERDLLCFRQNVPWTTPIISRSHPAGSRGIFGDRCCRRPASAKCQRREAGLKLHVEPLGRPEQASAMVPENPFTEVAYGDGAGSSGARDGHARA